MNIQGDRWNRSSLKICGREDLSARCKTENSPRTPYLFLEQGQRRRRKPQDLEDHRT
jgi:hypothetical protein